MKNTLRFVTTLTLLATPFLASAQTGINTSAISAYSVGIINVINSLLVPLLMAIAFLVFLYGVYKYFILGAADEKDRTEGRQFTIWGVIGFVVILSLWGIVNLVMGTFGLSAGTSAPAFPTIGAGSYVTGGSYTAAQTAALNSAYAAQQAACTGASASSAACGTATNAYNAALNGLGGSSQGLAQQAYDSCVNSGNTAIECLPAYTAYGGTGSPVGSDAVAQQGWSCSATRPCASGLECAPDTNYGGDICQDPASVGTGGCTAYTACTVGGQAGTCDDTGSCMPNNGVTPSAYTTCMENTGVSEICVCEADYGSWDFSNSCCSTDPTCGQ